MYLLRRKPRRWRFSPNVAGETQCLLVVIEIVDVVQNSDVCDPEIFISDTIRLFDGQPAMLKLIVVLFPFRLQTPGRDIGHHEMRKSRLMGRDEPFPLQLKHFVA